MNEPASLASWTVALRKHLDTLGIDSHALYRQAGLDPNAPQDPAARYPIKASHRLWQLAVDASGDPALGLHVSRRVTPAHFQALGYGLVASENLREVFERIVRYHEVVGDTLAPQLSREGERYVVRLPNGGKGPLQPAETVDVFAAIYLRTCRSRLGRDYAPLAVSLTRQPPPDPMPWRKVFRAPIRFAANENCLEFACRDFDGHLDQAITPLAHQEAVLDRTLGLMRPLTWERRVRHAVEMLLPTGVPDLQDVAGRLKASTSGLAQHLADEGWCYERLLDECRQNLALHYLRDAHCSLAEVGQRAGFADTGSFNRAFKRWTGLAPGQYRIGL